MTHEDQVFTTCEGSSTIDLIAAIDKKIKSLAEFYEEVTVQSISHDIFTQYTGTMLWTALIVANVKGRKDEQEDI